MSNEGRFNAWINPLAWIEVESQRMDKTASIDAESALSFLCLPGTPHDIKSLVERHERITSQPKNLFASPAEPEILEKLVWPLRQAKASYVIGNNLAVVALCVGLIRFGGHLPKGEYDVDHDGHEGQADAAELHG